MQDHNTTYRMRRLQEDTISLRPGTAWRKRGRVLPVADLREGHRPLIHARTSVHANAVVSMRIRTRRSMRRPKVDNEDEPCIFN